MPRFQASLILLLALSSSACWTNFNKIPGVKKLTTPKSGPKTLAFQKNYCSESDVGRPRVLQGSPLSTLLHEDKCSSGMADCAAGLDATKGTLPPAYEKLFVDLLDASTRDGGGPSFVYDTCDITSVVKPYILGIEGLGFVRSAKHQEVLVKFAGQYGDLAFNDSSTQKRLVRALFLTGKSEPAEAALRGLLDMNPEADRFKPEVLKYLATWDSSTAVDYCMETLRTGKGPKEACIWYLGEMRHREAYELIVRRMEDEEEAAIRALGHIGDPRAVEVLEKTLAATRSVSLRTVTLVALMNAGRDDLFPEFERLLRGRTVLSSGEETSRPKIGIIEDATLEALEFDDATLRSKSFEYVQSLGDLDGQASNGWRVSVFLNAARASLGDAEATKAIGALLDDPRKDVRHLVIGYIGAEFGQLRGLRVPDRSLLDPLTRAYEMEPSRQRKPGIVWAAAYIGAR